MDAIAAASSNRITPSAIGPQNGSSTNSQDQAITPVSFRVTKIRPSTEQIPIFTHSPRIIYYTEELE